MNDDQFQHQHGGLRQASLRSTERLAHAIRLTHDVRIDGGYGESTGDRQPIEFPTAVFARTRAPDRARAVGELPAGAARNVHEIMTLTDYPTAFDEGYAEYFQPLARDATRNPRAHEAAKHGLQNW